MDIIKLVELADGGISMGSMHILLMIFVIYLSIKGVSNDRGGRYTSGYDGKANILVYISRLERKWILALSMFIQIVTTYFIVLGIQIGELYYTSSALVVTILLLLISFFIQLLVFGVLDFIYTIAYKKECTDKGLACHKWNIHKIFSISLIVSTAAMNLITPSLWIRDSRVEGYFTTLCIELAQSSLPVLSILPIIITIILYISPVISLIIGVVGGERKWR